jgi:hypothetical protein
MAQGRGLLGPAGALADVLRADAEARGLARTLLDPYVSGQRNFNA